MRPTSRSRSPRTILLAAGLATLLLAPAAAFADEHEDELVELPAPAVDDQNVEESPDGPVTAQVAACDDELVTHSPSSSDGNELAVAITAQAVEAGLDGWINVAWEAAEGTDLRAVLATELDGSVTELPAEPTGSAFDVLSLTFCGTYEAPAEEPVAETPDPEPEPEPAAPAAPAPSSPAPSSPAPSPTETDDASDTDDSSDADDTQDSEELPEVVTVEPPEDTDTSEEESEVELLEAEEEPEAEVLGVQLTRDDGTDSGLGAWVVALAVVALLGAGAGAVIWSRRS